MLSFAHELQAHMTMVVVAMLAAEVPCETLLMRMRPAVRQAAARVRRTPPTRHLKQGTGQHGGQQYQHHQQQYAGQRSHNAEIKP